MPTLAEVNGMSLEEFVGAAGWVFEHSPWVAERAWATRPWGSVGELHAAMCRAVEAAPPEAKLALIRAHPDLGARARMAQASAREQRGAGLDSLSAQEYETIQRLNALYTARFGFPFIFAVKGKSKRDVFASMEARLDNARDDELREALRQIYQIAGFRLSDAVKEG